MDTPWTARLTTFTERLLTWRKRRRLRKKIKQQKKHVVVDWLEAFLWAAGVVLLINQYALQAYRIPSGSMMNTLLLGDRIFVNKLVYGPELLPGVAKIDGIRQPRRGEVIIFENPSYISRGTAFDIVQRVLYMVTLSIVDIDRDENGEPRAHFLIKRAVGVGGDRFTIDEGEMSIQPEGEAAPIDEHDFVQSLGLDYTTRRLVSSDVYASYPAAALAAAKNQLGQPVSDDEKTALNVVQQNGAVDPFELGKLSTRYLVKADPGDERAMARDRYYALGWYVPEHRILPLGDNRDNSRDGRYFGPVDLDHVLGKAMVKYWPAYRIGAIR